jgi:3-methyladenine DNA glycosylase Mpg
MNTDEAIESLTEELKSLKLRTQSVGAQLRALQERLTETEPRAQNEFAKSDRVGITNKVIRPANWCKHWDSEDVDNKRRATVTHWVRDQVWILTDDGTKTWRAPNNLEPLVR